MAATATTVDDAPGETPGPRVTVPGEVRRRLASRLPADSTRSWVWAGLIGLIAAVLRLVSLAYPDEIIFDEVYYANEGHSMLLHGSEWDLEKNEPKFVVHPPLGKWLIGIGIKLFGFDSFGWRIAAVVAGVVSVILLIRVGRRLLGSTVLGCVAGLLLTLDGMHFVSSRTALLDIFLMVFVLASFVCLVIDRDTRRARWLQAVEGGLDPAKARPSFGIGWWRVSAAVLAGCALSVKWSAVWYIATFIVLLVVWEFSTQRAAGVPGHRRWSNERLAAAAGWMTAFGLLALGTYVVSWFGWFADGEATYRHWLADQGRAEWPVLGALRNLFEYHSQAYGFHTTLDAEHQYQSWPWQWLVLGRPVAYYWSDAGVCGAPSCAAEILLLGTPLLWWTFLPALVVVFWYAMSRRDWRAWTILACSAMGIVPWFVYQLDDRTMFYFYALPSTPFLVLAVTMMLGLVIGPSDADPTRRTVGAVVAGIYVAAVALCFLYFYPIYVGETLSYDAWHARMWLGRLWI
ncbi:MAG: dolichyl-phosphate-mannose--protein mannosyltransferase [Micromonosporaceae bacterium]